MEEPIHDLESRVSALEAKVDNSEALKINKLAETSFKTVLDADIHLDNKASRILSAIAFLTAAASAIFARAYYPVQITPELQQVITRSLSPYLNAAQIFSTVSTVTQNLQKLRLSLFGFDLALLSFSAYIFFVILGSALYLAALGPSLNLQGEFRKQHKDKSVKSLLFFDKIAEINKDKWLNYWADNTAYQLLEDQKNNFIYETYLIAQKTKTKVQLMSIGSICFRLGFFCLVPLIASLFSFSPLSGWSFFFISLWALALVLVFEQCVRP